MAGDGKGKGHAADEGVRGGQAVADPAGAAGVRQQERGARHELRWSASPASSTGRAPPGPEPAPQAARDASPKTRTAPKRAHGAEQYPGDALDSMDIAQSKKIEVKTEPGAVRRAWRGGDRRARKRGGGKEHARGGRLILVAARGCGLGAQGQDGRVERGGDETRRAAFDAAVPHVLVDGNACSPGARVHQRRAGCFHRRSGADAQRVHARAQSGAEFASVGRAARAYRADVAGA